MTATVDLVQFAFNLACIINAIAIAPQIVRIFRQKTTHDISWLTFLALGFIQFVVALYAFMIADYLILLTLCIGLVMNGVTIYLTLHYQSRDKISLANIIEQLPGKIYWKDKDGTNIGCNTNNWKDNGYTSLSNFIGKTDHDLFDKEAADQFRLIDEEVMRTGSTKIVEEFSVTPGNNKQIYLSCKKPLRDKANNIVGIIGTSLDITERKQQEVTLLETKQELETVAQLQTNLVKNIEHDLRNPLLSIFSLLSIIASDEVDLDKKDTLQEISKCAKELLNYCESIVDFFRLTTISSAPPMQIERFILRDVIDSIVAIEIVAAKNKNIAFKLHYDEKLPACIKGDHYRLKRILVNLISNAIKFTSKGHVKLSVLLDSAPSVEPWQTKMKFIIEDTGIGIDKNKQAEICQPFTQHSKSVKERGLGMKIVKQFLAELNGKLEIDSHLNQGSIFTITLPFKVPLTVDLDKTHKQTELTE